MRRVLRTILSRQDRVDAGPAVPIILLVACCFFATGAAGLIYEVAWNRMLVVLMGNTSYALSTLLTLFMGGLALGAWLGGRIALRGAKALCAYGLLEIGVGVYCLVLPLLFKAADPLFATVYRNYYGSLLLFNLFQFIIAGILLLIPTTLMGATLPILVQFLTTRLGVLSRRVGALYAVNSGGAFVGCMAAGLVLLPTFGLRFTYQTAVTINVVVGFAAIGLAAALARAERFASQGEPVPDKRRGSAPRRSKRQGRRSPQRAVPKEDPIDIRPLHPAILLVGFGLSGIAAMVYQVAWTRAVTLAIGSSTYAFTLIAGAFILGLALGSLALGPWGDRAWGRYLLCALPVAIGFSALWTIVGLGELPIRMARLFASSDSFVEQEWAKFRAIFFVFLPSTLCMGGLLPIVTRFVARREEDAGRSVGNAYTANALGAIVGSFCGGFVLIPLVGMRLSIMIAAGLSIAVGAVFFHHVLRWSRFQRITAVLAIAAIAGPVMVAVPSWQPSVMTSGPFIRAGQYVTTGAESDAIIHKRMKHDILYYKEGAATLVTVARSNVQRGRLDLIVGGKPDAFNNTVTPLWLGHLPLLLHPDARSVLVVGLGSGQTLSSVQCHPGVEAIDCVEISAEVAYAARQFFGPYTDDALEDPRVKLIIGDGRLHLEHTDQKYDVIISQPSNPWIAGASALFTREAFSAMKDVLNPRGVACIWFQGFRMPTENVQSLCRTWADVWDHCSMWSSTIEGELLFVGSEQPLEIDFDHLHARYQFPNIAAKMRRIALPTPAHAISYLMATDDHVRRIAGDAVMNTDDNSRIEYDTPKGMWRSHIYDILRRIHRHRVDPWRYVTTRNDQDARFDECRRQVAERLADQYAIMRSLDRSPEERSNVLREIVSRNPYDPMAQRELRFATRELQRRQSGQTRRGRRR